LFFENVGSTFLPQNWKKRQVSKGQSLPTGTQVSLRGARASVCGYTQVWRDSMSTLTVLDATYSIYSPIDKEKHNTALFKSIGSHCVLNSNSSKQVRFILWQFPT